MKKFQFRLHRVHAFRILEEEVARDRYLAKQAERVNAEGELANYPELRRQALAQPLRHIEEHGALTAWVDRLDDEERAQRVVVSVLTDEEEALRQQWISRRQDAQALEKLRTKAYEEWLYEANREEQNALDEFATQMRITT